MIYKKTFRPICLVLCAIIMIGVCGCMNSQKVKMSVDECINYMVEKYGEKFIYVEPYSDYQTNTSLKIIVQSENIPDSRILVVSEIVDGKVLYHDNYLRAKYESLTFDLIQDIARTAYGDCRVIYTTSNNYFLPDSFGVSTTFEEYCTNVKSNISAAILLPPSHKDSAKDKEMDDLYNLICENKIICSISVYYTNDLDKYQSIDKIEDIASSSNWYGSNGQLSVGEEFEIASRSWGREK